MPKMDPTRTTNRIFELLTSVEREGMDALLDWLVNNGFFSGPASSKHHLNVRGGLAEHSLHSYDVLEGLCELHKIEASRENRIISAICHDVNKVKLYTIQTKKSNYGNGPSEYYKSDYSFMPYGHGEGSVIRLQKFIKLEEREILAIRYHMGAYAPGMTVYGTPEQSMITHAFKDRFVAAMHIADMIATHIVEKF